MEDHNHFLPRLCWDSPNLLVPDIQKAIHFYEQVFGFQRVLILPDENHQAIFARMRYRGTIFIVMLSASLSQDERFEVQTGISATNLRCLYVDDVMQAIDNAKSHGCHVLKSPYINRPGDERASLLDIFGYIWELEAKQKYC